MPEVERFHGGKRRSRGSGVRLNDAEIIEYGGIKYAEVIWAETRVSTTRFFSPPESSFQFGLLAHGAGYREEPHYHKATRRVIDDLQQMFVMQHGVVDVELYSDEGKLLRVVTLRTGDAIVLVHGAHAIRVVEEFQALSVKQGPFFGDEEDKIEISVEPANL
jgi:hypothetical protein